MIPQLLDSADVVQSNLGSCYFLASLSSLAGVPSRVQRIFSTTKVDPSGCYGVRLCVQGIWEEIILDDLFPCRDDSQPFFSSSNSKSIWVLLAEKAFAKICGGYANLISGIHSEALYTLTGAPTTTYFLEKSEPQEIFRIIKEGFDFLFPMSTSTLSQEKEKELNVNLNGLVASHSYSILGIFELSPIGDGKYSFASVPSEKNVRLLRIRDPKSMSGWNGKWGDKSTEMKANRQLLDLESKDGIFYMLIDDFMALFRNFSVCYYHNSNVYSAMKTDIPCDKPKIFQLVVKTEGDYYITASQCDKRVYENDLGYSYSFLRLIVGSGSDPGDVKSIGGNFEKRRETWMRATLQPGTYFCYIGVEWASFSTSIGLSIYGPDKVKIRERTELSSKKVQAVLLENFFRHMALTTTSIEKRTVMNEKFSYIFEHTSMGFGYFLLENKGLKSCIFDILMKSRQNIVIGISNFQLISQKITQILII